jgi:hypothetical protein
MWGPASGIQERRNEPALIGDGLEERTDREGELLVTAANFVQGSQSHLNEQRLAFRATQVRLQCMPKAAVRVAVGSHNLGNGRRGGVRKANLKETAF